MDKRIEQLQTWGCDTGSALERVLDDEEFYIDCLRTIPEDAAFAKLRCALEEGNLPAAFDCAHTLKGVLANLGLTPMYRKVVEIVEPLRQGQDEGLLEKADQLTALRDRLDAILQSE